MYFHLQIAKALFIPVVFLLPISYSSAQGTQGKARTSPAKVHPQSAEAKVKLPFDSSIIIYYKGPEKSPKTPVSNAAPEPKKNDSMSRVGKIPDVQREPADLSKLPAQAPKSGAPFGLSPITIYYPVHTGPAALKSVAASPPRNGTKPQATPPSNNSAVKPESGGIRNTSGAGLLTNSFLPGKPLEAEQKPISQVTLNESSAFPNLKSRGGPASLVPKPHTLSISAMMPRPLPEAPAAVPEITLDGIQNPPATVEADSAASEESATATGPGPSTAADKRPLGASPGGMDWIDLNNAAVNRTIEADYSEAQALLERAIEIKPDVAKFHRNLSIVFEKMKDFDKAVVSARKAAKLAPTEPSMFEQLCPLELGTGNPSGAVVCFEKLRSLAPLDVISQTYYGTALFRSGNVAEALPVLEEAARSKPSIAEAQNAVGVVYFSTKRIDEAIAAFKSGVEIAPDIYEIRFNLAVAELSRQNKAAALSQYNLIKSGNAKLAARLYNMLFGDKILSVSDLAHRKR